MTALYDRIGHRYAAQRRADPRVSACIRQRLEGVVSLLNVGAGAGSYEPSDLVLVALEPSWRMIMQRCRRTNVAQAVAEAMPFKDDAFDAALAVLTIHHWQDAARGMIECARVVRRRVVILTWDPAADGCWLVQGYFPELSAHDRNIFPTMDNIQIALGRVTIEPVAVPADCVDGFLGAYWRRPHAYLDAAVSAGMSSFARQADVEERLAALRADLSSGAWERRHGRLLGLEELDIGYRLVTATWS